MNKMITTLIITLLALAANAVRLDSLSSVTLTAGDNAIPAPARAVALNAIGTNESGTVTLKKVTALSFSWTETRTVTNIAYTTAWSNLTHTVTNDIVTAWRTNTVAGTVVSNYLDRAVNAIPSVYPFPDLLILTNKVPVVEVYTNIPYQVEAERRIKRVTTPRRISKFVTNDFASVTLADGYAATNLADAVIAPGEFIVGEGTAFDGGSVQLIFSR